MDNGIGLRVGAILKMTANEVDFLGYGTYDGDFLPPFVEIPSDAILNNLIHSTFGKNGQTIDPSRMADLKEMVINSALFKNPKITLDSGDVVWGCECWWSGEERIARELNGKTINLVRAPRLEMEKSAATAAM